MKRSSSITHDTISLRGAGVVTVRQPATGHRFTLDSVLLADFCRIRARDRVLEAGAGAGIISLLLAKKHHRSHFSALELQAKLHNLCMRNIEDNGLTNLVPLLGDIRKPGPLLSSRPFDIIVMNPPYTVAGTGRTSLDPGRRTARQDATGSLEQWLELRRALKQGGRFFVVFPAGRLAELLALMQNKRLEPKRLRLVHPAAGKPASLALIEAVRDGGTGLTVLPPLLLNGPDGSYTRELREIYGG